MLTFEQFLTQIDKRKLKLDKRLIRKAYDFAYDAHDGQKRFSGDPYITHPLMVAYKLLDFAPDSDMVVAALLHDVSEDTERTLDDIEAAFGPVVRKLVSGLEKLSKVRSKLDEPHIENLRKMFVSMADDIRVILIKLCDRWHNMDTLEHVRDDKKRRIAKETLDIYVPIASRLGIYVLKGELEDLCFKYLYPDIFIDIDEQLNKFGEERSQLIETLKETLLKYLTRLGFKVTIESRIKTHYSIYQKLKRKGKSSIDDIFDVFALRVVAPDPPKRKQDDVSQLYQILGAIHSNWTPLSYRFKDYVAIPKPNGYRSLHTTVVGLGPREYNRPIEIQIRTQKMHREAEFGVASHWIYKVAGSVDSDGSSKFSWMESQVAWISALDKLQQESTNQQLMEELQGDLLNDRIFVLTPHGDVKDLPRGATPIDFAYAVHTDVGHHCYMAKANGAVVPLDSELKNGQVVEIMTRKSSEPNQYWLSFVRTNGAKNKIKSWFKSKDGDRNLRSGRDLLNKYLNRVGQAAMDSEYSILKNYGGGRLTVADREKLLEEIGLGMVLPSQIVRSIFPVEDLLRSPKDAVKIMRNKKLIRSRGKKSDIKKDVVVDGMKDLPVKFAKCCKPKKTDSIIGYVTRGEGISIHKANCKIVFNSSDDRLVSVSWANQKPGNKYKVALTLEFKDRMGILRDVSDVVTNSGVNIVDVSLRVTDDSDTVFRGFVLEVDDYDQLERVMDRMERIENVISVKKASSFRP